MNSPEVVESGKICIHDCRNAERTSQAISRALEEVSLKAFGKDYSPEFTAGGIGSDRGYGALDAQLAQSSKGVAERLREKYPSLPPFKFEWVLELSSEGHAHIGFFRITVANNG